MSATRSENSTTATKFRALIQSAKARGGLDYPRRIDYLGSFSDGTRYLVEYGSRDLEFYLVTDLTAPLKYTLIAHSETPFTDTVSDTPAVSLAIPINTYSLIHLESEVEMDTGAINELDKLIVSFTPDAGTGQAWSIKILTAGTLANIPLLTTRASTMYKNQAAHTAGVNVAVTGANNSFTVKNFRAWGAP